MEKELKSTVINLVQPSAAGGMYTLKGFYSNKTDSTGKHSFTLKTTLVAPDSKSVFDDKT